MKALFDKRVRDKYLQPKDLLFLWDVRREEKGKNGKFDSLWFVPFKISEAKGNNTI